MLLKIRTRKELLEYLSTQQVIVFYFAEITYCIKAHLSPNHYTNLHYKFTSPRDLDGHKNTGGLIQKCVCTVKAVQVGLPSTRCLNSNQKVKTHHMPFAFLIFHKIS